MATNISTIGATGRTYSLVSTWEAATDNDLVTAGDIEVGEMYDDATFAGTPAFGGATTDATHYRWIRAASGEAFDPATGTGVETIFSTGATTSWQVAEDYFRLGHGGRGIGFDITANSSATHYTVQLSSGRKSIRCNGLFIKARNSGDYNIILYGIGAGTPATTFYYRIQNCITVSNTGTQGPMDYGFLVAGGVEMFNCVAYNAGASGVYNSTAANGYYNNIISVGSGTSDFDLTGATTSEDYNCSSDSSASGSNSITSQTDTDLMTDPANDDFTLKAGSNAIAAGIDRSAYFTADYDGVTRSTWDMGAFYYASAAATPDIAPIAIHARHRALSKRLRT